MLIALPNPGDTYNPEMPHFSVQKSLRCKNLGIAHLKPSQKSERRPGRTQLPLQWVVGCVSDLLPQVAPWVGRSPSLYFIYFKGGFIACWGHSCLQAVGELGIRS